MIYELYTDTLKIRRLPMLPTVFPAIHRMLEPTIKWISFRKVFWTMSVVGVVFSLSLVYVRGVDMFDTEFRGGTAVTMKTAFDDDGVRGLLPHTGPGGVEIRVRDLATVLDPSTPNTDETRTRLLAALRTAGVITGNGDEDLATVRRILAELATATILTVGETEVVDGVAHALSYQIKVASPKDFEQERTSTSVVVAAIVAEFGNQLDVTQPLTFRGAGTENHAAYTFPVTKDSLGVNIDRRRYVDNVTEFMGGMALVLDDLDPPVTVEDVEKRIGRMRAQPDFTDFVGRDVKGYGLELFDRADPSKGYTSIAVLVYAPELSYFEVDFDLWDRALARAEWELVSQAMQRRTSLEQVSSFSAAVAQTLSAKAIVAVVLSLLGILVYIWVRFGSLRYSAAAIVALLHDVCITLGILALTAWIGGSALAKMLLIEEFRIDLGVVAALLTIIGYSLNDTIVILDRIRENRGKLPIPTPEIVNKSINQTISRTVLTSFTTLLAVGIMYAAGGSGIRPFAFCLLTGLVVGTYSSVAIAAPLVVTAGQPTPPSSEGALAEGAANEPPAVPRETATASA